MKRIIRKEKEIYQLYEEGLSAEQIAEELLVSVSTVQFWLTTALEKKRMRHLPEDK